MDWSRVPVFLKVVDQGSFTAAAKALGVPKSTASRAVTSLENELETQLLQRTTRSLELTEAGRAFYERAKAARAALEEAQAEVHHASDDASGVVRLSLPNDAYPMAELLARFTRKHPNIHIELVITNRHVHLVEEGIDLALRAGKLDDSSLIARKLAQSDLGLFASSEYLRRHPAPKKVEQLGEHEVILFRGRQGKARIKLTRERDGDEQEITVRGALSVDDLGFMRALVSRGSGIGLLPIFITGACAKKGHGPTLERVLPEWGISGGGVHLVMPASKYVPARVRLLADFIAGNFTHSQCGGE
ncbi:MAG: LysR family transcriptional regulator [Archangium sp.]|nr:LysR family transcriptional regulator [Archangium sp.]